MNKLGQRTAASHSAAQDKLRAKTYRQDMAKYLAAEFAPSRGSNALEYENAYNLIMYYGKPPLMKFSDESLTRITGPDMNRERRAALAELLVDGLKEEACNDFMQVAGLMEVYHLSYDQKKEFLSGLAHYEELPNFKEGHYPEERATAVVAIMKVVLHMHENPHNRDGLDIWEEFRDGKRLKKVPYLKDEKVRRLLTCATVDRDAVVDIITKRSLFDADQIVDMLTMNDASALRDGNL